MGSTVKLVDQGRSQPHLVVMGLAQRDVLVNVEVAVRLSFLVQPDQRAFDDKNTFMGSRWSWETKVCASPGVS